MGSFDSLILKEIPQFELRKENDSTFFKNSDLAALVANKKGVFVHFWATWCAPCEDEFPLLAKLANNPEISKDYAFILVAVMDKSIEIKKMLKRLNQSVPSSFVMLLDPNGEVAKNFGTIKLPETYLINSHLAPVRKFVGPQEWSPELLTQPSQ